MTDTPQAGWYDTPGGGRHYWDGTRWADPVAAGAEQSKRAALDAAVAKTIAEKGGRVAYQGADRAVVVTGRPVNHILHLLLTIVTGGVWIFAWILISATGGERSSTFTVDDQGSVRVDEGKVRADGEVRWLRLGCVIVVIGALLFMLFALAPWYITVPVLLAGVAGLVFDVRRHGVAKNRPVLEELPPVQ